MPRETFSDALEAWHDANTTYHMEGSKGVSNLCKLVAAIGYNDPFRQGSLSRGGRTGDLIVFFEDNPGALQAVVDWITEHGTDEWKENLESELPEYDEDSKNEDDGLLATD